MEKPENNPQNPQAQKRQRITLSYLSRRTPLEQQDLMNVLEAFDPGADVLGALQNLMRNDLTEIRRQLETLYCLLAAGHFEEARENLAMMDSSIFSAPWLELRTLAEVQQEERNSVVA